MGKLWSVYCEDLGENWLHYNSTALYYVCCWSDHTRNQDISIHGIKPICPKSSSFSTGKAAINTKWTFHINYLQIDFILQYSPLSYVMPFKAVNNGANDIYDTLKQSAKHGAVTMPSTQPMNHHGLGLLDFNCDISRQTEFNALSLGRCSWNFKCVESWNFKCINRRTRFNNWHLMHYLWNCCHVNSTGSHCR